MGSEENMKPDEFYDRIMIHLWGLTCRKGYGIVTPQGAKQRGWVEGDKVDPIKLREDITYTLAESGSATIQQVFEKVTEKYGAISEPELQEAVALLVKDGRLFAFHGSLDQSEKPELIHGTAAVLYSPQFDDVLITPALAVERGWISGEQRSFILSEGRVPKKFFLC